MRILRFAFALALLSPAVLTEAASSSGVTFIPATTVTRGFVKGMPLLEVAAYKVHASRREGDGMVEVHVKDTDIAYVLEGTATVVTGGTMVGGRTIVPDEIRGVSIDGGTVQHLAKGDVIVIPNGVPHWFREVQAPCLYYVVKVTANGAAQ